MAKQCLTSQLDNPLLLHQLSVIWMVPGAGFEPATSRFPISRPHFARLWVWRPHQARLPRLLFPDSVWFWFDVPLFHLRFLEVCSSSFLQIYSKSTSSGTFISSQERSLNDVRDTLMIDAVEFTARLQTYITVWRLENLLGLLIKIASYIGEIKRGFVLV